MEKDDYLDNLYLSIKAIGLVQNQWELSALCGRTPSWFSAIKARQLPLTAAAAINLSIKLRYLANRDEHDSKRDSILALSNSILQDALDRADRRAADRML